MLWLTLAALATPPEVHSIRWARPFVLAEAHPYTHTDTPRDVKAGWLLELRVDPGALRPLQVGVPLLWVGQDLAVPTNWDHVGGCAVVWVPGPHALREELLFYGSTELPERVGAERRAIEHADARTRGVRPLPATAIVDIDGPTLVLGSFGDLMRVAADRVQACSPTDAPRLPSLRSGH